MNPYIADFLRKASRSELLDLLHIHGSNERLAIEEALAASPERASIRPRTVRGVTDLDAPARLAARMGGPRKSYQQVLEDERKRAARKKTRRLLARKVIGAAA